MSLPSPSWSSVRKLLINNNNGLPDFYFARRFCILVVISVFITSQGDFTTTQRIVDGLSSLIGIDKKTRWKYISIMLWKASEFGIGWWLDCTGTVHRNPCSLFLLKLPYRSGSCISCIVVLYPHHLCTCFSIHFHQHQLVASQYTGNFWSVLFPTAKASHRATSSTPKTRLE
jgi:hypothetical protein